MKLCVPNAFPISLKNMNDVKRRNTTLDMFPETRSDDHCNVDGGWIHRGHGPVPYSSQYRTNSHKRKLVVQEDIDWSSSKIHIGTFLAKSVVKYVSKLSKKQTTRHRAVKKKSRRWTMHEYWEELITLISHFGSRFEVCASPSLFSVCGSSEFCASALWPT